MDSAQQREAEQRLTVAGSDPEKISAVTITRLDGTRASGHIDRVTVDPMTLRVSLRLSITAVDNSDGEAVAANEYEWLNFSSLSELEITYSDGTTWTTT